MRNLVVASSSCLIPDLTEHLARSGWRVTYLHNAADARDLAQQMDFMVGLAVLPENQDTAPLGLIQRAISALPHTKWIMALAREALAEVVVKRFVSKKCYDFQIFPLNGPRLSMALGHAYGMAEIEREFRSPQDSLSPADLGLIGNSPVMRELCRMLQRAAESDISVLISGPTGTGKEKAARAIHNQSARSRGPFVALNCAAIPPPLVASELFGHVKGAFTDAQDNKVGHVKAASGGTLFLDEIGDMPLESQGALLRFIEDMSITPVGSTQSEPVDVRLIAATNKNLEAAIQDQEFRADLFYRIAVLAISTPSLASREGDVVLLAKYFLDEAIRSLAASPNLSFTKDAITALSQYSWPGNVRELRSVIFQSVIECNGRSIGPDHLNLGRAGSHTSDRPQTSLDTLQDTRNSSEKQRLVLSLKQHNSNVTRTAKDLGISRMTLYRLMVKHGVSRGAGGEISAPP